ncbi:Uncharacterised protein [Mycobacterium tuberculosis]|uniref:Uncharacterized protein n=1 Tax=Mycobacterium tuberculosis TaxID=1773 RepID=A0A655JA62_MYCTX|nr:Uncharacterised protein [Mycobacterium tuberculosis]COX43088.1 Uncharacterised protein [Mycobacterium tuberculosis]COX45001.1 Uncharacterised protein [Mycobacterium tuberculosis]COY72793.1 Uncharacterised protein [Mycobacterium tuberculosis]COZ43484.1 Uncharacterised protein [Mycobacterium tuberculosis]
MVAGRRVFRVKPFEPDYVFISRMFPPSPHVQLRDILSLLGHRSAQFGHVEYPLPLLIERSLASGSRIAFPVVKPPEPLDVALQRQVESVPPIRKVRERCALVARFELPCRFFEIHEVGFTGRGHPRRIG